MANDIIDINVYETVETVAITVNPNLTTVNINQVTGGGGITNLSTTQTTTDFTINSDTGDDAIVPLGNGTLAGATLNNYTTAEKNKLGKYPSTATNGKILQGNGTSYVEIDTPTGTTNLGYIAAPTIGTVTSSTGDDATIPLADSTNAGLFTPSEKSKLLGIATGAEVNVNADWNAVSGDAQILNKPTLTNFVPYTGATNDVDLGLNDITAAKLIKDGGFNYQFLKADGSVDNNTYLTSADLPSTLDLYATTTASDISGYTVLVRNISDTRYNTTAVNVPTPTITGTSVAPTFCGAVISDTSILLGNPGVFNFSVIGKIRRTGGSTSSGADFFFSIYKRNLAGVEELIANSAPVVVPANGGIYVEYISIALWNNGIFLSTDRVVLKFYGVKTGEGSGAAYEFQFGGSDPVRGTAAISSAIIPNLYLRDLADVEKVDAVDKEVLYWNDAASLWEHSLAENLVPNATASQKGLVSTTIQTFGGAKTFTGNITTNANIIATTAPTTSLGSYNILTRNTSTGVFEKLETTTIQPLVYNILITSTVGITTQTLGTNAGAEYSQDGRNVMINNSSTEIIVTATNASNSFVASYTKLGTANITFATGGTLVAPYGAVLNGNVGSTALLTKNGTTVYLLVNNLL